MSPTKTEEKLAIIKRENKRVIDSMREQTAVTDDDNCAEKHVKIITPVIDGTNAPSLGITSGAIPIVSPSLAFGAAKIGYGNHSTATLSCFTNTTLDEVRASTVVRPTNWIWAEYLNSGSNSVFNSYGLVQSQ